jgi:hypothetical protein
MVFHLDPHDARGAFARETLALQVGTLFVETIAKHDIPL